jgi:O-succinylbenzoate synthase
MRIERIGLHVVRLPLVRPFRTSSSVKDHLEHILVEVVAGGVTGWGECASPSDPYYCPETTETCWHILRDFLGPLVIGKEWGSIDELRFLYKLVKGNNVAKAGLEMACWDALARAEGEPLRRLIGGVRKEIASGVSLGIETDLGKLIGVVEKFVDEGYKRVKLKIGPGNDLAPVKAVRERFPDLPLQVDANSAYTLEDVDMLRRLDEFGLLLIEQPLAHDDIVDHARLQAELATPVCLDESIHSAADARKALDLGACRVINIKVSRVGGLMEARKIHDLCYERGVPVWIGGMHEFGIGRAANLAVASLPGFVLPGDVSGSDKYYREDLVEPPVLAREGMVAVPAGPGLGHEPVRERIERARTRHLVLGAEEKPRRSRPGKAVEARPAPG